MFDGRLLKSKPSGVRDIAVGLSKGLRALEGEGRLDLIVAGSPGADSCDLQIESRGFMHFGLPRAARQKGADRILVPRQTIPIISKIPIVPVFHDIGFLRLPEKYRRNFVRDFTTKMAGKTSTSLAVSEYTANEVSEYGFPVSITPLPIQAIHDIRWAPVYDDPYILCVAAHEPHKNLVGLVRAWKAADIHDARLIICGRSGVETTALMAAIDTENIERIELVANLEDEAYEELLSGCVGYIQPSFDEGLCIPALDLAAAGAPTAVSSLGNLGYIYSKGGAEVFDPYSIEEMAKHLNRLLYDESFKRAIISWNKSNISLTDWREVANVALGAMS
ncbi:glycosyltransferase [Arthrobacter crystallopoietes]|nr:glycosyltransferase [Arthrobacter crystallopoietes]